MKCPNCNSENFSGFGNNPLILEDGLKCLNCGWQKKKYIPSPNLEIWHPRDIEYYEEFPAPLHENMQRMHFSNVNSTTPFFSHMLYYFVRQCTAAEKVLEIGTAEGYTSFFLAHAVKDSAIRFNMSGNHFYGLDIVQVESTQKKLRDFGLPATIVHLDSKDLSPDTFKDVSFDLIYQDGDHSEEAVVREFKTMWPQLKDKGNGYWISHDSEGPAWHGCKAIRKLLKDWNEPHEVINLGGQYGLMIIRKMIGFNYDNNPWKD